MIAHLQRATTTAALIPALYGLDEPHGRLRPRLIGADYRGADKQLPLFGDPQEVLGGGVLDAPALRIGARAPEYPVWMCSVRSDPRHPDLSDAQWADVARRLVAATGLAPAGDPHGCRWAAIRNGDRSVHVVATVVREDGYIHGTYRDPFHVQAECTRIAADLGHLTRTVTTAKDHRMPVITISAEPSGSVVATGTSDDLSATLLRHAGFKQIDDWHGRRHRLPTTTAPADRASIAAHAAKMLRAARYKVGLDPRLEAEPLNTAGQQVLNLTDALRGATDFAELAEVLDELLDPDDGMLVRLQEALEIASEQITDLDADQFALSDRFGFASDQLVTAQAELAGVVDEVQRAMSHAAGTPEVRAADDLRTRAALARSTTVPVSNTPGVPAAASTRLPPGPAAAVAAGRTR
ncbi:hypothetical protein P3T27_005910 [Kitasatospora sp. MAA19]|uniref:hypothetical protein n=1 Tax=unclassified Kitasatospora TaxID=2633591 RepID=UPI00247568DB|nr:hypothetical protein [Kitasatospora sp. MAA19]MDH6709164.1 hypothetical protein [Kitasatospora sp. MAA19]